MVKTKILTTILWWGRRGLHPAGR